MAVTSTQDFSIRHGKMSKNSRVVYRVRNGKQQSYTPAENTTPPSKAQTAHRKFFGKVNTIVNAIMADPKQKQEWTEKLHEYNRNADYRSGQKRYTTTRSFVFATISAQLAQKEANKRKKKPIPSVLPRGHKLIVKHFAELTTTQLYEILKARFSVFYTEQNCRYLDMDDVDYNAIHIALFRKGKVVAYARLFQTSEPDIWQVGRMLTTERKKGLGKYIMEQTLNQAIRSGAHTLMLHAQTHATGFYESFGFSVYGDIFTEADMPHVRMRKSVII